MPDWDEIDLMAFDTFFPHTSEAETLFNIILIEILSLIKKQFSVGVCVDNNTKKDILKLSESFVIVISFCNVSYCLIIQAFLLLGRLSQLFPCLDFFCCSDVNHFCFMKHTRRGEVALR